MTWLNKIFKKKTQLKEYTNSPQFVISMLKKLQARRSACIVHFQGDQEQYVTMILDVESTNKQFTIDEIVPREGQRKATTGENVRITASDNGIAVIFKTKVLNTISQDNNKCCILELPQYLEYKQRRAAFRVAITQGNNLSLKLHLNDKEISEIIINDISFTGISFIIKNTNLTAEILTNSILDKISLTTAEQENIELKVEVKRVRFMERDNSTFVAGRFLDFTHQQQRRIDVLVSQLERANMLKKQEEI